MSARASVADPVMAMPISPAWRARAWVKFFILQSSISRCAANGIRLSAQPLDHAASRRHDNADQVRIRGGWSGGAPMRPSAIKSTSAKDSLRVWKETWIALVGDELARAIV